MDIKTDIPQPSADEVVVSPGEEVPTQLDILRDSAEQDLKKVQEKDPKMRYEVSPHFITVYKDTSIFARHDLAPSFLNDTLEASIQSASYFFGVKPDEGLHLIELKSGGDEFARHISKRGSRYYMGVRYLPGMDFSRVVANGRFDRTGKSIFIGSAIQNIVADRIVSELMTEQRDADAKYDLWLETGLIRRGLANYIRYRSQGIDPDDVMKTYMADYATDFGRFRIEAGELRSFTPEEVKKVVAKRDPFFGDVSIREMFGLNSRGIGSHSDIMNDESAHFRGASFVNFLIETLGVEKFKAIIKRTDPNKFKLDVAKATGLTLNQLEKAWKARILENFEQNEILDAREAAKPDRPKVPRTEVKEIYAKYS